DKHVLSISDSPSTTTRVKFRAEDPRTGRAERVTIKTPPAKAVGAVTENLSIDGRRASTGIHYQVRRVPDTDPLKLKAKAKRARNGPTGVITTQPERQK
ncbi:hypothetical protein AAVH_43545, partial [Aphelenchoides avenae]